MAGVGHRLMAFVAKPNMKSNHLTPGATSTKESAITDHIHKYFTLAKCISPKPH